ncbi:glycoside hydrolase family 125 protein [Enterococcus faecalis]
MIDQRQLIEAISSFAETINLSDQKATDLFRHVFADTITHTITVRETGEVFVATGDIPAMWLRDSTFQVLPYLEVATKIPEISAFVHGVLKQQLTYIKLDPYANAFNWESNDRHYSEDQSNVAISPQVWERKFEIDSLCTPFLLAYQLYWQTGYTKHLTEEFWQVVAEVMEVFIQEQHHETSPYFFQRKNCPPSDTLPNDGRGTAVGYTGMVWSGFRPSDDACQYGYFIPGNQMIVVIIRQLLQLIPSTKKVLKEKMLKLQGEIEQGIETYGLLVDEQGQRYYAYEVDGLGGQLFMDDANVPSLLSLPFLGYCSTQNKRYCLTRQKILSPENPYFYTGALLEGIGSPHTPPDYVWPISLAMEGLTSENLTLVAEKINLIAHTDADTLQCHEGIDVNNPQNYTREWFSWANMTYCKLVFHYLNLKNKSRR